MMTDDDRRFLAEAVKEAELGWAEGGIPIGSVLVKDGEILGRGHNKRQQNGSVTLHGEMDALENAGRLRADIYKGCTIYTTLSPCPMCSGAILLYKIPRVVLGENVSFQGDEEYLHSKGVELVNADDPACKALMARMMAEKPELWAEDIGV